MFATLALQIKAAVQGGARRSVEKAVSELAGLCDKCKHDMQPIRVLQQVNTTACNWDRLEKPP